MNKIKDYKQIIVENEKTKSSTKKMEIDDRNSDQ